MLIVARPIKKVNIIHTQILFLCVIVLCTVLSCKARDSRTIELSKDYPSIKIESAMGDLYKPGYMALIGNLGYLVDKDVDTTEVLIISQRIEPGKIINYNPIGVLIIGNGGKKENIIVATTPNELYTSVEIEDLSDLSVHFGHVKRMIEQWYDGLNGIGGSRVIRWESKKYLAEIEKD